MSRTGAAEISKYFGRAVRDARILGQISQQRLANEIGMNRVTLAKLEAGKTNPSLELTSKLALRLHIHVDDLIDRVEQKQRRP